MAKNNCTSFKYIIVFPPWRNNRGIRAFPHGVNQLLIQRGTKIREAELRMHGALPTLNKDM